MTVGRLNLAQSRWAGGISELAVMTPIIPGRVPGERRTYEERLRAVLASLADRGEAGLPTPLSKIPTFHFARVMLIRPEHYLTHSRLDIPGFYHDPSAGPADRLVPKPFDQFREAPLEEAAPGDGVSPIAVSGVPDPNPNGFRSWLMTLVIFDGDPNVYLREIAAFIESDFDSVFENCEDYPYARNFEKFWAWVRRFQIPADVFYTPYPNLSVARIKQLEAFKTRFDAFVASVRTPEGRRVERMDELFDAFLRSNAQHAVDFPSAGGSYLPARKSD